MMAEIPKDRFTKVYLSIWGICILVALFALGLYKSGLRLSNDLEPVRVTAVSITSNVDSPQIYLNNREQKIKSNDGRYLLNNITPGLHSFVISKDGYWPWAKTVSIVENNARTLFAFMFPMDGIPVTKLSANTAEYIKADTAIRNLVLPVPKYAGVEFTPDESIVKWLDKNVPLRKISRDGNSALYVDSNTIYVAWISETEPTPHYFCEENPCKLIVPVIVTNSPVKSVDFYRGRSDVIIFTEGKVIYAIGADREGTQNFQPLYKGVNPYFFQDDSNVLYIKDDSSIFSSAI